MYETWESEAEGMPGWKNCILKAKYLCQTSSALWTGHTLCRHKYWALFLQLLTDSLFPCSFCWGSMPYRPCAVLLLTGLDLQCCFFDETGWQLHQFWGSVEFYIISWYCIFLLVLGVLQVKTFCCVFLAEFCCCWCAKHHRKKQSWKHKMLPNVDGEAKYESCSCLNAYFRSGSSACCTEQGESCLDFSVEFIAGFDLESWGLREVLLELTVP